MKRVIIDTNGYLRLLQDDNQRQANQVESLLKKARMNQIEILLPQIIVFEMQFMLEKYYRLSRKEIKSKIESLFSLTFIHIEAKNVFLPALIYYSEKNISFVDSFLHTKAIVKDAELFTFDKKLALLHKESIE